MFAGWAMEYRRRRLLGRAGAGPLREFYRQPFVAGGSDCRELRFVALDLETTGLDPMSDAILSIGLVEIHRQRIDLSSARHVLLRADRPIPEQSVIIHRITDDQAAGGERLESVLPGLLARLAGKVLVAHHADFEMRFLGQACQRLYGAGFLMPVIDTQRIARRGLMYRRSVEDPEGFWAEQAELFLDWDKPWDKVLEWDFHRAHIRWFEGGKLNVCYNCVDRHLPNRAARRPDLGRR
jgi:DNA polymerase III subunit epsilon